MLTGGPVCRRLGGINTRYITRSKLLSGRLRASQEKLSRTIMDAGRVAAHSWPRLVERFVKFDAPRLLKSMMLTNEAAAREAVAGGRAPEGGQEPVQKQHVGAAAAGAGENRLQACRFGQAPDGSRASDRPPQSGGS